MLGLSLTLGIIGVALLAEVIAPFAPLRSAGAPLQAPSLAHPMGTDDLGRDILSGVVYGARTSLLVGLSVSAIAALLGTVVGLVAGHYGGWVDDVLMRFTELVQVLPRFFLAVIIIAFFGAGLSNLILVLGLTSWPMLARILRSEVLSLRQRDFIVAARAVGVPEGAVLLRHVLPNVLSSLLVTTSLLMGSTILIEASLSFLGLGDPNAISWGYMLNNAQAFLRTAWWMAVFPGLAIVLTVLAFNLSGDGLNDAFNPRFRRMV